MEAIWDQTNLSALDEATEQLLREIKASPTDLTKLVMRIALRRRAVVPIAAGAIARWNKDDPDSGTVCADG